MRFLKAGLIAAIIYMIWISDENSTIHIPAWAKWILIPILSIILVLYMFVYFLAFIFIMLLPHKRIEEYED